MRSSQRALISIRFSDRTSCSSWADVTVTNTMYPRRSKSVAIALVIGSWGDPATTDKVISPYGQPVQVSHLGNIPTISFRAPFPALLAFRRRPCSLLLPKYRTLVVPKNAIKAALHARFWIIQSYARSVKDCDRGAWKLEYVLGEGRIAGGSHD